jgi:hypothetical protein
MKKRHRVPLYANEKYGNEKPYFLAFSGRILYTREASILIFIKKSRKEGIF